MGESSESFDYGESDDINSKRKSSVVDFDAPNDSDAEDDSGFEKLPDDALKSNPAKRVKFLQKQTESVFRPIPHFDDEEGVVVTEDDPPDFDPDPAYQINEDAFKRYKETIKLSNDNEKRYNIYQLSRLNARKAKIVDATADPKLATEPGAKKSAKLIALQEAGKPARDEYLDLDSDNVIYLPCKPPEITEVDDMLGPAKPPGTSCFACTRGVGFPMMNGKLVENLERYMREVIPNTNPMLAAVMIAHYYATKVQAPTNRNLSGDTPLPDWEPRQVYDCIATHRVEPSVWQYKRLRELQQHAQLIRECGLYNFDAGILADNRVPCTRDIRISKKYEASYFKTIELEMKLYGKDPKKMIGHNDKLSIASSIGGIIGQKTNTYVPRAITDIFSAKR
jgi:hypothetical protein